MKLFLQIAFLLLSTTAVAQYDTLTEKRDLRSTDFYHLKMPGGNEQNSVTQFLQDSDGRMWIATKDGLVSYNGKKLRFYRSDPDNPHSIGHNFVTTLFLDRRGLLWVGTEKGLWRYRPVTDNFVSAHPELDKEYITDIAQDTASTLWIVNHRKNRLYRYDPPTGNLQLVADDDLQNGQGKPDLLWITIDAMGRFFITDENYGFIRFFPATKTFHRYRLISEQTAKRYDHKIWNIVAKILPDRDDTSLLWIGTNLGYLIGYDLRTGKQRRLFYNTRLDNHGFPCYNSDLYEDDQRNLWITTWFYGTFKILPDRRSFVHFLPDPENKHSISNTITTAIYQDQAGYLWFGTEYQGIDILKKNKKFYVFPTYPPRKDALPPAHYLTIVKDGHNRVWVGAEGGIYSVDKETLKSVKKNDLFPGASRFFCLYYDPAHRLWAGTERGVYCVDENGKLIHHFTYKKDDYQSISCNFISDIRADRRGNIWIGTFCAGLVRYNTRTGKFYRFTPDPADPRSISHPFAHNIFVDKDDEVWVGTPDGLNKLNATAGNFVIFRNDKSDPATISSSVINDINATGDTLWIATQGGGLNMYDKRTKTFHSYTVKDGLPDNNVKAILTDDHGRLWLSTTRHIVRFDPHSGRMITYTRSDGLENRLYVENMGWQSLTFGETMAYKDEQGYLYFGGSGGLLFFHPDSLPVNTYHARLIIETFRVNGKERNVESEEIVLQPDENQLEIGFTLMNLIQSQKNRYAWKLEPYDTLWHQGDYLAKAEYFGLPPGQYRLYYKAANNDGIWTVPSRPLQIIIKPHFYQTNWFIVLMLALFLLLVGILIGYRHYIARQIEKKRRMMRYSWSHLDEAEARRINEKLLDVMQDKNIYLEPDLSLNKLASIIEVKPNYLSQIINQFHGQNFFEFINTYRIEEAKRLLCGTTLKVEAVAYDSGFNSLSTFNAAFKKATQTTPTAFRKSCPEKRA